MSKIKTGLYKSHPKSIFVDYSNLEIDPDTLEYNLTASDEKGKKGEKIPVVVLQIVNVGIIMAEVLRKTDYCGEVLF